MIAGRPENRGLSFCLIIFFAALFVLPSQARAADTVSVKSIRHWNSPGYSRVIISLSGPANFDQNMLGNPERLFIDFKGCTIKAGENLTVDNGILKRVRAAQHDTNTVRVVLDLSSFKNYKVFPLNDPYRVVVDVYSDGQKEPSPIVDTRKVVVLDPGHGGHDPGAVGPDGLKEKDIVLDVALKLGKLLEKCGYNVVYTRDSDVFLGLDDRTAIANQRDADLFVSIHANASPTKSARGMETYLLNWTDNEEAIKVAARENAISVEKMKASRSELGFILASLELQNKRDESLKLANYIQNDTVSGLREKYRKVVDLGVKQALFYVLVGAKMPSVLVEVSFITNPEEAVRLKSPAYRENVSKGIAGGIMTYFTKSSQVQEMAQR